LLCQVPWFRPPSLVGWRPALQLGGYLLTDPRRLLALRLRLLLRLRSLWLCRLLPLALWLP
jgi:hypothetical protein